MSHRPKAAAAVLGATLALSGCGLGAGESAKDTELLVTRDFGRTELVRNQKPKTQGSETVMRLLQRNSKIETRYGGGFVQSINGLAGGKGKDWLYYVNGVFQDKGAADTRVNKGDKIWWDHHRWDGVTASGAIVGSFPEPFLHGQNGKPYAVSVQCSDLNSGVCKATSNRLKDSGVKFVASTFARDTQTNKLRLLVGPWSEIKTDEVASKLGKTAKENGVFAQVSGSSLDLTDSKGKTTKTLKRWALLAGIKPVEKPPTWVLTSSDAKQLENDSKRFLEPETLAGKFAVAFDTSNSDEAIALPAEAK